MRDYITARWDKTGLLDAVPEEIDKMLLSQNLQKAAVELISRMDDFTTDGDIKSSLFIPIIVRLFTENNIRVIDDIKSLYDKFDKFYVGNYEDFKKLNYLAQDGDVEFCAEFVKNYEML